MGQGGVAATWVLPLPAWRDGSAQAWPLGSSVTATPDAGGQPPTERLLKHFPPGPRAALSASIEWGSREGRVDLRVSAPEEPRGAPSAPPARLRVS